MWELLAVKRVNRIMRAIRDIRELPQNLIFLNRTRVEDNVPDGEIIARYTGYVSIADVIADNQEAVIRNYGTVTLDATKIPNIKHGRGVPQDMLNLLSRIEAAGPIRDDEGIVNNWLNRTMDALLTGVRQRQEFFMVGMMLDTLTYDRLGVKFTATFGTPSDLKVTPSVAWSDTVNATPIADVQTQMALGREKYGKNYNRLTMTSVAFRQMIATAEFRNKATLYAQTVLPTAASFPIADISMMTQIAGRILGAEIELYDAKYYLPAADLVLTATAYLPDTKVVMTDKSDDNNGDAYDLANGIVTESIVAELTGTNFAGGGGGFGGQVSGPVGYVTLASHDLNPPGVNAWAVARAFPRKHDQAASSILTIG